jgi:uncharacterized protein (UPF0212 family)
VLNQRRLYDAEGTTAAASNSANAFQMMPIPFYLSPDVDIDVGAKQCCICYEENDADILAGDEAPATLENRIKRLRTQTAHNVK